jgi:hypothetical protein
VLVARFPVSLGVALGVVVAVTGAFVFSLPALKAPVDETILSQLRRYQVAQVRRTFGDYGVRLRYTSHPSQDVTVLAVTPPPWPATALYVSVPREGDVVVHDGGANARVRARVKAAVAALARR